MHQSTIDGEADLDPGTFETFSALVVEAVAEAEGVDPIELQPLYGTIDPDALDSIFHPQLRHDTETPPTGEVVFVYHGYEVSVTASGRVTLTDLSES